jgi:hypothetical protein
MMHPGETRLYIALVHHPVVNKRGESIGSAVTNLDIHDIARTARTYGVARYYLATPYVDQQDLVRQLLEHWQSGHGATYNPARKEALSIVRLVASLDEAREAVHKRCGEPPMVVVTSAVARETNTSYAEMRMQLRQRRPVLVVFGTAHGLAREVLASADTTLPPIVGCGDYNHLSVRSAAAIILDRLLGEG